MFPRGYRRAPDVVSHSRLLPFSSLQPASVDMVDSMIGDAACTESQISCYQRAKLHQTNPVNVGSVDLRGAFVGHGQGVH